MERVLLCAECGQLLDKVALVELLTTYEAEEETELFEQVWHKDCYLVYAQRQSARRQEGGTMTNVASELADLFLDVDQEHRNCTEPMTREYWQGKKDGLRTALALLDKENADHWQSYQESSHNRRLTKLQILTEMVNDAVYYIGEVLWAQDGGDIHPMSVLNMQQWFDRYGREAEQGNVPVADDTCYSD